jgi:hypothetical protein
VQWRSRGSPHYLTEWLESNSIVAAPSALVGAECRFTTYCYEIDCIGGSCGYNNLRASVDYDVRIRAKNNDGEEGPWWNADGDFHEVRSAVPVAPDAPILQEAGKDAFSVTIKFTTPEGFDDGGSGVSSYLLSKDSGADVDVGGTADYVVTDLLPDTAYAFAAKSRNSDEETASHGTVLTITTSSNDLPVLTLSGHLGGATYEEDAAPVAVLPSSASADITDSNNEEVVRMAVQLSPYEEGDELLFENSSKVTGVWNSAIGLLTLAPVNSTGTKVTLAAALFAIKFRSSSQNPSTTARSVIFRVYDGYDYSPTASTTCTITVTRINDAPAFTTSLHSFPSNVSYLEDSHGVELAIALDIRDVDSEELGWVKFEISSNYDRDIGSGGDIISCNGTGLDAGIAGQWYPATGVFMLTPDMGSGATRTLFEQYMHRVVFNSTSHYPSEEARVVSLSMRDTEETETPLESATVSVTIRVTEAPDHPEVMFVDGMETYTENQDPIVVSGSLTILDRDDANLVNATVRILAGYAAGDVLTLPRTFSGITATLVGDTLLLTGVSPVANYQDALRAVTFHSTSSNISLADRRVQFEIHDSDGYSENGHGTFNTISVHRATPHTLVFATQPGLAKGGEPFGNQPELEVRDAGNVLIQSYIGSVTLVKGSNSTGEGALSGNKPVSAVSGRATFRGLSVDTIGAYQLRATAESGSGTSVEFGVTVGATVRILFTTPPETGAKVGTTLASVVAFFDAGHNIVTASDSEVTLAKASGACEFVSDAILTAAPTAGMANFSDNNVAFGCEGEFSIVATATVSDTTHEAHASFNIIPARFASKPTLVADSSVAAAMGTVLVSFTTSNRIPSDGNIVIEFPPTFTSIAASPAISDMSAAISGTLTASTEGLVVTLVRVASEAVEAEAVVSFRLDGVTNPNEEGTTAVYPMVKTTTSNVSISIDEASESVAGQYFTPKMNFTASWAEEAVVDKTSGSAVWFAVFPQFGALPYSFQWQWMPPPPMRQINYPIAGATATNYSIHPLTTGHSGTWTCEVKDSTAVDAASGLYTLVSHAVNLTVATRINITRQPAKLQVSQEQTVEFTVGVEGGTLPYRYQWWHTSVNGSMVSVGTNSRAFAITDAALVHEGIYQVVVTDSGGGMAATSTAAELTVNMRPALPITECTVSENSAFASTVCNLHSTDANSNDTLSYAIINGNNERMFYVVTTNRVSRVGAHMTTNGEVRVSRDGTDELFGLDLEREEGPYELTVEVTDDGIPPMSVTATVTLYLANADDKPTLLLVSGEHAATYSNPSAMLEGWSDRTLSPSADGMLHGVWTAGGTSSATKTVALDATSYPHLNARIRLRYWAINSTNLTGTVQVGTRIVTNLNSSGSTGQGVFNNPTINLAEAEAALGGSGNVGNNADSTSPYLLCAGDHGSTHTNQDHMAQRFCELEGYTGVDSIQSVSQGGSCAVYHNEGDGRRFDASHGSKISKIVCTKPPYVWTKFVREGATSPFLQHYDSSDPTADAGKWDSLEAHYIDIDETVPHNNTELEVTVTGSVLDQTAWGFGRVTITVDAMRTVYENSPVNTTIGLPIQGADADGELNMRYSLESSADAAPFSIGTYSGQLYVAERVLDKESKQIYSFKVIVADEHDDASLTAESQVTVYVLDGNDAPVISATQTLMVDEITLQYGHSFPVLAGTVSATDQDLALSGDSLTYELIGTW